MAITKCLRIFVVLVFGLTSTLAQAEVSNKSENEVSLENLQRQYPNAKIVKVSPDEYGRYKNLYAQNSVEVKKNMQKSDGPIPTRTIDPCLVYEDADVDSYPKTATTVANPNVSFDYTGNLPNFGGSSGNDKEFLIIVAVIGVVVVAALLVYSVAYLYKVSTQGFRCKAWSDFGVRYSHISDRNDAQIRSGQLSGLYFSTGYRMPYGVMGLTAELGHHNLDLEITQAGLKRNYEGAYLMVGPSFSIPFDSIDQHAFQIELLAGTSTEKDIGLMSTLRFGLDLRVSNNFSLGLNVGAALVDIHGFDNYIKDSDQLNYLSGISTSFRF